MNLHALARPGLSWLDRFIVPRETPVAPSRWHQHVIQRRISRLDHLRPQRLNWEALKHPEPARGADDDDEVLTPRRLAGIRWSWLDGFVIFGASGAGRLVGILLYVWLALGPVLWSRPRPVSSTAGAA